MAMTIRGALAMVIVSESHPTPLASYKVHHYHKKNNSLITCWLPTCNHNVFLLLPSSTIQSSFHLLYKYYYSLTVLCSRNYTMLLPLCKQRLCHRFQNWPPWLEGGVSGKGCLPPPLGSLHNGYGLYFKALANNTSLGQGPLHRHHKKNIFLKLIIQYPIIMI